MIRKIINRIKWIIRYKGTNIKSKNIGRDVSIGTNVSIAEDSQVWGGGIGDYTYIMGQTCIANAKIGKFCSIGQHCSIGGWIHPYSLMSTSPLLYREILNTEYNDLNISVVIENDVWICDNAVIIKGTIGTGAVIGAGAVVTHDVPPYAIVVGNPGRVIGYRFDDSQIFSLLESRWWDWDIDKIKKNRDFFMKRGKKVS